MALLRQTLVRMLVLTNDFVIPLGQATHGRNAVPGFRAFRCDDCGHSWQEPSRDCMSSSGEHCEKCSEFVIPYLHFKNLILMCHDKFSVSLCRDHPQKMFVFGDNLQRKGKGGQAVIRDEPNAYGIATKLAPLMSPPAFFPNTDEYIPAIDHDILRIKRDYHTMHKGYSAIVFPVDGLGTGRARLSDVSPTMWDGLNRLLYHHLGYRNVRPE